MQRITCNFNTMTTAVELPIVRDGPFAALKTTSSFNFKLMWRFNEEHYDVVIKTFQNETITYLRSSEKSNHLFLEYLIQEILERPPLLGDQQKGNSFILRMTKYYLYKPTRPLFEAIKVLFNLEYQNYLGMKRDFGCATFFDLNPDNWADGHEGNKTQQIVKTILLRHDGTDKNYNVTFVFHPARDSNGSLDPNRAYISEIQCPEFFLDKAVADTAKAAEAAVAAKAAAVTAANAANAAEAAKDAEAAAKAAVEAANAAIANAKAINTTEATAKANKAAFDADDANEAASEAAKAAEAAEAAEADEAIRLVEKFERSVHFEHAAGGGDPDDEDENDRPTIIAYHSSDNADANEFGVVVPIEHEPDSESEAESDLEPLPKKVTASDGGQCLIREESSDTDSNNEHPTGNSNSEVPGVDTSASSDDSIISLDNWKNRAETGTLSISEIRSLLTIKKTAASRPKKGNRKGTHANKSLTRAIRLIKTGLINVGRDLGEDTELINLIDELGLKEQFGL